MPNTQAIDGEMQIFCQEELPEFKLANHVQKIHKQVTCSICNMESLSKVSLRKHNSNAHKGEKEGTRPLKKFRYFLYNSAWMNCILFLIQTGIYLGFSL